MSKDNKKKKHSASLLKRLFGGKSKVEEMDLMQEELLQSPMRTIIRNFFENKLALGAVIVFLTIFLIVLIGPIFAPTDLNESEETQTNVGPGLSMMSVPKELEGNVKEISTGATFSVGVDNNGKE